MSFDDLHTGIALDAVNSTYDLCMVDGSGWRSLMPMALANPSEMGYSFDDDVIEATTTICKVDDDIYLAPYYGNVTVMMYNKQLIADAGYAPEDITTFEDLRTSPRKPRADSSKNGFLIRGGSADNIPLRLPAPPGCPRRLGVDENEPAHREHSRVQGCHGRARALYKLGNTLDKDDIVAVTAGETALAQIWPGWYVPTADGPADYTTIPTKLNDLIPRRTWLCRACGHRHPQQRPPI